MSSDQDIRNTLIWLEKTVLTECGDGDAIWITKYHKIDTILPIVLDLNNGVWYNWWTVEDNETEIMLHHDQESWVITTDENYNVPSWSHCVLHL
tara:strand:- start:1136 stop:1417 length:282 start_codon:yes stop_codon:yes gene_type:complete